MQARRPLAGSVPVTLCDHMHPERLAAGNKEVCSTCVDENMREVDVDVGEEGQRLVRIPNYTFFAKKMLHPSSTSELKIEVTSVKGTEPSGDKLVIRPQRWKYMPEALNHNPLAHRVQIEN